MQAFVDKQVVAGAVACVGRPDGTVCLEAVGYQDIVAKMRNPGPGMTKFEKKDVSDKEARAIAEYILKTFK